MAFLGVLMGIFVLLVGVLLRRGRGPRAPGGHRIEQQAAGRRENDVAAGRTIGSAQRGSGLPR